MKLSSQARGALQLGATKTSAETKGNLPARRTTIMPSNQPDVAPSCLIGKSFVILLLLFCLSTLHLAFGSELPKGSAGDDKPAPVEIIRAEAAAAANKAPASGSSVLDRPKISSAASLIEPRALESNIANARVEVNANDMQTAAGHHHGKSHGKYYMYTEVPKKHSYKMGFKRGNHKHEIERKESVHKHHVHSYFKWHDKKGKGSHKFEFKHHDKKKHGHY